MISVNGKEMVVQQQSVLDVIKTLQVDPKVVVAELNQEILIASEFDSVFLKDGDVLEIVRFVGGG